MAFLLFVLFALMAVMVNAHNTLTLTWYKHGSNCTVLSGTPKSVIAMNVCSGVTKYMDGSSNSVNEYMYEDYGMCKVPCTDGNNLNCQWGLYYPYYLNKCNTNRCSYDQYWHMSCSDEEPFATAE